MELVKCIKMDLALNNLECYKTKPNLINRITYVKWQYLLRCWGGVLVV